MSHGSTTAPSRICLAAVLLFAASTALAQGPAPEITLRIRPSDLEVLVRALDAMPIEQTADTIIRIQTQVDAQAGPEWEKYRSPTTVRTIGVSLRAVTP